MFDRWDIMCAYNMYAKLWGHDPYTSYIERRLHAMRFQVRGEEETLEGLSDNAKAIYGSIVRRERRQYVAYERLHRRAPHVFPAWPGSANIGRPSKFLARLGIGTKCMDMVCP